MYIVFVYWENFEGCPTSAIRASFDNLEDARIFAESEVYKDVFNNCASIFSVESMREVYFCTLDSSRQLKTYTNEQAN